MFIRNAVARSAASLLSPTRSSARSFATSAVSCKSFQALVKEIRATNKDISYMEPAQLGDLLKSSPSNKPIVVDCREMAEITTKGTIPGAIPLPRGVLERDIQKFVPNPEQNTRNIVVYCAGGMRSVLAAESLVRLGYATESKDGAKVTSLEQGFEGWVKAGLPVQDVAAAKK